jgi:hypothetical protein
MSFNCAPVLLLGFNRPDFMVDQIDIVRQVKPSKLYIAVDGPRDFISGEDALCKSVRRCVDYVDWSCDVKTLFRERNLGCRLGVSGAISWFFDNEVAGIVLEDDCRPSLEFFRFASEMLERYADDERIGAVNGFNYFNLQTDSQYSYHFSSHMDIWGWASWRRAWKLYDVDMKPYIADLDSIINSSSMIRYMKRVKHEGALRAMEKLSTWDFQFSIASLANHWLNIVPRERLVVNVGQFDQSAVHTGGYNYWAKDFETMGKIEFPLCHPKEVVCDDAADRRRERIEAASFPRALTWIGAKFPVLAEMLDCVGDALVARIPKLKEWNPYA